MGSYKKLCMSTNQNIRHIFFLSIVADGTSLSSGQFTIYLDDVVFKTATIMLKIPHVMAKLEFPNGNCVRTSFQVAFSTVLQSGS